MHRFPSSTFAVLLVCLVALAPAAGQQIARVIPEVGAPGDVVMLTGSNLSGTTGVRFGASVGGFAGFFVIEVPPIHVTSTTVTAIVPRFENFLPPGTLGSEPIGTIDAGGVGFAHSFPFFYLEQTAGRITTAGLGTTIGGLSGRPVIGFRIETGQPVAGNDRFTLTLGNATPFAKALLAVGVPSAPQLLPYLDGFFAIDMAQPWLVPLPFFTVNAAGDVLRNLRIPPPLIGVTVMAQWIVSDPITGALGISNGMSVAL